MCIDAYIYIVLNTARNTAKLLQELVINCDNMSENKGKIKTASILKQLEINLTCEQFNVFIIVNFEKRKKIGLSEWTVGISIVL